MRASMALDRTMSFQQRNGRPSFWERPSPAPPDPKGRCCVNSRPAGGWCCQRRARNQPVIRDLTTRREHQPAIVIQLLFFFTDC